MRLARPGVSARQGHRSGSGSSGWQYQSTPCSDRAVGSGSYAFSATRARLHASSWGTDRSVNRKIGRTKGAQRTPIQ